MKNKRRIQLIPLLTLIFFGSSTVLAEEVPYPKNYRDWHHLTSSPA